MPHKVLIITNDPKLRQEIEDSLRELSLELHHADGYLQALSLMARYAVAAIRGGDDIKTVQGNMGHATAAFTLDVYGHVTDQMKQASAARMEKFIQSVSGR